MNLGEAVSADKLTSMVENAVKEVMQTPDAANGQAIEDFCVFIALLCYFYCMDFWELFCL